MSQENVEIVRSIYDQTEAGQFATSLHLFHPDVVYTRTGDALAVGMTGAARGIEAMIAAMTEWLQTFTFLRVRAERFMAVGDRVVVFTHHTGSAKESGVALDAHFADVLTLHDGVVVRLDQFRTRDQALEAAGLSE
jgi:ketosteroid isomerase-like protein